MLSKQALLQAYRKMREIRTFEDPGHTHAMNLRAVKGSAKPPSWGGRWGFSCLRSNIRGYLLALFFFNCTPAPGMTWDSQTLLLHKI
jgi:hypothetical protein